MILQYGNIRVEDTCYIHHRNSTIYETSLILAGGVIILEGCEFGTSGTDFVNNGYTFFVNSQSLTYGTPSALTNSGNIYYIDISSENFDSVDITDATMDNSWSILGSIHEINDASFSCDVVIIDISDDSIFASSIINSKVTNGELIEITSLGQFSDGEYKFIIRFDIGGVEYDVYTFTITVSDSRAASTEDPTASPSGEPTSSPEVPTEDPSTSPTSVTGEPSTSPTEQPLMDTSDASNLKRICYMILWMKLFFFI